MLNDSDFSVYSVVEYMFNRITNNSQKRKDRAIIRKYKAEIAVGKCQSVENVKGSEDGKKKLKRPSRNPDIKKTLDRKASH